MHTGQRLAHGVGRGPADSLSIEVAHPAPGREGGGLGGAQQLEAEVWLDRSRRGHTARGGRGDVRLHALCELLSAEGAGFLSASTSAGSTPALTAAAFTKSRERGCGRFGPERDSGGNCEATNQGGVGNSMISNNPSVGEGPPKNQPPSPLAPR